MANRQEINLAGLKCPVPIVELNRTMKQLGNGDELCATADDPAFELDVQVWCKRMGQDLRQLSHSDGKILAVIRKVT